MHARACAAGLVLAALHGDRLHRLVSHAGMAGGPNTSEPGWRLGGAGGAS